MMGRGEGVKRCMYGYSSVHLHSESQYIVHICIDLKNTFTQSGKSHL